MRVIKVILDRYRKYKDPVKYWRNRGLVIGERCEIRSASFGSEPYLINIGNHVRINSGVQFITHDGGTWVIRDYLKSQNAKNITLFRSIKIGNNVHIGTNAIIMPGVTIGNNCIIGCGAIVTRDIPNNSVAVGIPARVIETIDDYINKNHNQFLYTKNLTKKEKDKYLKEIYKYNDYNTDLKSWSEKNEKSFRRG